MRKDKNIWQEIGDDEKVEVFRFCDDYIDFLSECKTERECVEYMEELARENGFKSLDAYIKGGQRLTKGDKVLVNYRNKVLMLFIIGERGLEEGLNIVGSHIDAPRIDLKPSPLYEDEGMVLLKTHYYGGIKKYQWTAIPLAIHGVIIDGKGEKIEVVLGEDPDDAVFTITDLLPHLAKEQSEKKISEAITGEGLNILFGSIPEKNADDKEKDKNQVKMEILRLLKEKYHVEEEDFISAELTAVPAGRARDVGLDRSMLGGYGQDDRVCAYTSFRALLDLGVPEKTCAAIFVDKEEVGSMGNTGMQSRTLENILAEILNLVEEGGVELKLRRSMANSKVLSADVTTAIDPNFEGTHDKRNACRLGNGVAISKYGGSKGKSNSSDASAEFISQVRNVFNSNNVVWQSGELGKVDLGGGGTIAQFLANYGMEVLDCGVPLLSMHAPFEVASKADIYMTYRAYRAFYTDMK
ncbi:MAG: putative M18-family aminopeptidase 1 [Firmicutes bacterium]|nr:putative M18-family aminopeptidase 1 [Bacillota bacterium]